MEIPEIVANLRQWLEAHPEADDITRARVRRALKTLEGIDG